MLLVLVKEQAPQPKYLVCENFDILYGGLDGRGGGGPEFGIQ